MSKRIVGIDLARALAFIGMVLVNYKMVFGSKGNELLLKNVDFLTGKGAATFVVLAGVGIAFMSNSAVQSESVARIKEVKIKIAKRALFLFMFGLSFLTIFSADILHFYGIYMLVTVLFLNAKNRQILIFSALLIFIYPFLFLIFSYDQGWNFFTFEYAGVWTLEGFLRNLFFNGFHPVIPWVAFMLVGLWFGKNDLRNLKFVRKSALISFSIFLTLQIISSAAVELLSSGDIQIKTELLQIFGFSPMPPFPIYMLSGSSFAIFVISASILTADKLKDSALIDALCKTGRLALTFYVAHVVLGMGFIEWLNPADMGKYSITFSVLYALVFCFLCVIFTLIWEKYSSTGPLEWIMRKVSN